MILSASYSEGDGESPRKNPSGKRESAPVWMCAVGPRGNKQMANGPREAAFAPGLLCCRIECSSALVCELRALLRMQNPSWQLSPNVHRAGPLARWEVARTLANCFCVLSLREEIGEEGASLKPRGSPPTHPSRSPRGAQHVLGNASLGCSSTWHADSPPCLTERTKQTRTERNGRGSGQGKLLCSLFCC